MSLDLSIVIPIYNARGIGPDPLERLTAALDASNLKYEILLRDDGSTDDSAEMLRGLERRYNRVVCSYALANQGLGCALRHLFTDAKGASIVYCDYDLPFGAEVIPLLLDHLRHHDIVAVSRYQGARNHVPRLRKFISRLYFIGCKFLFGMTVKDIGSGTVAFRSEALSKLDLKAGGFGIHAEIFVKARREGLSVQEVAAENYPTERGSFRIGRHCVQTLRETMMLWWGIL
jgi:glycosyltransferase involved in cell wall biosynthesis